MHSVRYVEEKTPDWERVREILQLSAQANHWTNFGPVSRALEQSLADALELHPDRSVVMCSSATAAIHALAGVHAARQGRKLRWISSAYTFFSVRSGALADSVGFVDCDEQAMLDLRKVDGIPADAWDGLIVTNIFGLAPDAQRYVEYCRARQKALIVDSAQALLGVTRGDADAPMEAISFHHTKPWGVGEGGCALVRREDESLVRAAINFGVSAPEAIRPYCGNGKISDIACAAILDRWERMTTWASLYAEQRRRIAALGADSGLVELRRATSGAVTQSVPFIMPGPLAMDKLGGYSFDMRKYYRPLASGFPRAEEIFSRMLNVPCHPGMAAISDDELRRVLDAIGKRSRQLAN